MSKMFVPVDDALNPGDKYARENLCISQIKEQIANYYGNFTGDISKEPDHIAEYIDSVFTGSDVTSTIEKMEEICNNAQMVEEYDYIKNGLRDLFKEELGVSIEDDDSNTFSVYYDVYITFILSLSDTIERSAINYYRKIAVPFGKKDIKGKIAEYCLSDEISLPDDFIKNAAVGDVNVSVLNVNEKINNFQIVINHDILSTYLHKFVDNVL